MAIRAEHPDEKKPKRQNGEGSVFFWPGRGWYAAITGVDGRRIMRKAPKQTERGAETLLRKLLADRQSGELTRLSTTLEQFLEEWLKAAKRRGVKPRTLDSYREKLESYALPKLGKKRLDRITAADLDRLYDGMAEEGLSPATIGAVHTRLGNLLKLAKRRRLVSTIVTEMVDPPKVPKYDARTLTIDEARQFLHDIVEHRHGALWTFILGTGCRFGEAAGLRWQDIDTLAGVAQIRQVVNRYKVDGRFRLMIDPHPKSEAGRRDIPLPRWVLAALERQRAHVTRLQAVAGDRWPGHDLVFPNSRGGPLRESNVDREWHELLAELKLEGEGKKPLRMHDLRHSKGTLMADEGEDLVVIQKTLGHARSSITADLYIGRVPKALRGAADRYGDLLAPPGGTVESAAEGAHKAVP